MIVSTKRSETQNHVRWLYVILDSQHFGYEGFSGDCLHIAANEASFHFGAPA